MSAVAVEAGPMVPLAYRVAAASRDPYDTCTIELDPGGDAIEPLPGQFAMLYAFGIGEVPISLSGLVGDRLVHTVRDVGAVTHALCALEPGDDLGVRGPFGNTWPLVDGADHVVIAGGLGLAPLRPAIRALTADPERFGRVSVLYGARTPDDLLFPREWQVWHEHGLDVRVTVDAAPAGWDGTVGLVTQLIERAAFDPATAVALVCGPEIMMRFAAKALAKHGLGPERTFVSLERAMKCGIGHCGHCQLGPTLVCRDGPVYAWSEVERWLGVREL